MLNESLNIIFDAIYLNKREKGIGKKRCKCNKYLCSKNVHACAWTNVQYRVWCS